MLFKGVLPLDEFGYYFIGKMPLNELKFLDENGATIDATIFPTTKRMDSFWGSYDDTFYSLNLKPWFKQHKAKVNDHINVTVHNYQTGTLRLSLEAAAQFEHGLVAVQNIQLADIIYDLLNVKKMKY